MLEKAEVEEKKVYTLKLSKEHARMIKGLMQNPQCPPEEESLEDRRVRSELWNALPSLEELR